MRVVLDTNVIISGLNFQGNERLVLDLARRGRFDLCLSNFVLQEVSAVLDRKFGWHETRITHSVRMLGDWAQMVDPTEPLEVVKHHPADNLILACAVEASADYLVTGDRRHLLPIKQFRGTRIVNAASFLSDLDA